MTKNDSVQINLSQISKSYTMGLVTVNALKDVSLEVAKGEFLVILGPSGSGKTTLLNLVGGIDSATSGNIQVNGIELSSLNENNLTAYRRSHIGFVFQFFNLIPTLTAWENIEFAAELTEQPRGVASVLDEVGLTGRGDHYPSELSGGEQQRVAIARALVKDPPILLADEPTGELDYETGKHILSALRRINKDTNKTVLLVTHNTAIGDIADRVVRLRDGHIIEDRCNASPIDPDGLRW
jgi:putative ABC transport system ATP-binding protein